MYSWRNKAVVCSRNQELSLHAFQKREGERCVLEATRKLGLQGPLVACNAVLDSCTGLQRLFCVVSAGQSSCGDANPYEVKVYDELTNCLSTMLSFRTAEHLESSGCNVCLINGPTLLWAEGSTIHVVANGGTVSKKVLRNSINVLTLLGSSSCKEWVVDRLWAFDWDATEFDSGILVFLRLVCSKHHVRAASSSRLANVNCGVFEWMNLLLRFEGKELRVEKLGNRKFLPSDYGQIATTVSLSTDAYFDPLSCSLLTKCYFLVGTTYKQVVVFLHGRLLSCVPMEDVPKRIVALQTIDDCLAVAVWDCSGRVTAIKLRETTTEKVDVWEGVTGVLTGDFIGLGHEQLLLLFEHGGSGQVEFCITDLVELNEGSQSPGPMVTEEGPPSGESLATAVKALKLRRQKGEAYLVELERECEEKLELLRSSLHFMTSLSDEKHRSISKPDPSLVSVIPGKTEEGQLEGAMQTRGCAVTVVSSWQRVLDETWCSGVVIKNTSESVVGDIAVTLVLQYHSGSLHKSTSTLIWIDSPNSSEPPAQKKQKIDRKTFNSDSIRTLSPGCSACVVVTSQLTGFEGRAPAGWLVGRWREEGECRVTDLLHVELSLEALNAGEYCCSEESFASWRGEKSFLSYSDSKQDQDVAALLATRKLVKLTLSSVSPHAPPTSPPAAAAAAAAVLRERLPLPSHAILPPPLPVAASQDRPINPALVGVLLYTAASEGDNACVSVLYRSGFQLSLLLATMEKVLPDCMSVCVQDGSSSPAGSLARWLNSIRDEIAEKTGYLEQMI